MCEDFIQQREGYLQFRMQLLQKQVVGDATRLKLGAVERDDLKADFDKAKSKVTNLEAKLVEAMGNNNGLKKTIEAKENTILEYEKIIRELKVWFYWYF